MTKKRDMTDLRDVLFDTLQGLKDKSIEVDRAKAINDVAQTLINSAKVEVETMKLNKGINPGSGFIPTQGVISMTERVIGNGVIERTYRIPGNKDK